MIIRIKPSGQSHTTHRIEVLLHHTAGHHHPSFALHTRGAKVFQTGGWPSIQEGYMLIRWLVYPQNRLIMTLTD